ncbi:MAG: PEP-CTERM sorting domain-containing protein [Phycisphaeraceae bacterium]|jgi:hypothetical protein|nr:PEP-CTERM sorting domain-containing protein [Phycisphaeraceae bacterium]
MTTQRTIVSCLLAIAMLALSAAPLFAGFYTINSVSASSDKYVRRDDSTIDNSGMSGVGSLSDTHTTVEGGAPVNVAWLTEGSAAFNVEHPAFATNPLAWIEFDLGAVQQVDTIASWAWPETDSNYENFSVKAVSIQVSKTGNPGTYEEVFDGNLSENPNLPLTPYSVSDLILIDPLKTRFVVFGVADNYRGSPDVGLGEVRIGFFTVPEPATVSLLGMGAMGLLRRRRAA